jgi:hypothetical protein
LRSVIFAFTLPLLGSATANASCTRQCIDGQMQPLSESSIDLPPLCPPTICPLIPQTIAPLNPLTFLPLGTSQCSEAQICDRSGNCRCQQVCRRLGDARSRRTNAQRYAGMKESPGYRTLIRTCWYDYPGVKRGMHFCSDCEAKQRSRRLLERAGAPAPIRPTRKARMPVPRLASTRMHATILHCIDVEGADEAAFDHRIALRPDCFS